MTYSAKAIRRVIQTLPCRSTPTTHAIVDNPHPTAAEFFEDAVVRNGMADHWGEILGPEIGQVNECRGVAWTWRRSKRVKTFMVDVQLPSTRSVPSGVRSKNRTFAFSANFDTVKNARRRERCTRQENRWRPPCRRALALLHWRCLRVRAAKKGVQTTTLLKVFNESNVASELILIRIEQPASVP
jgi:hypothetical protein